MKYPNYNDYELVYMVKENSDDYYDILYKKYLPIIKRLASDYYMKSLNYGCEYEDFLQEANIAFYTAIKYFNEDRNILFYTFVTVCIKRRLISYTKKLVSKNKATPLESLDNCAEEIMDKTNIYQVIEDSEFSNLLKQLIIDLPMEYSCILELKINNFSSVEIASLLELPVSTVQYRNRKNKKNVLDLLTLYNQ